jgi:arginase family enzyme
MNPFQRIAGILAALALLGACSREVTVKIGVDGASVDFTQLAQKIIDADANVVFFGGDEATGMPLLKACARPAPAPNT